MIGTIDSYVAHNGNNMLVTISKHELRIIDNMQQPHRESVKMPFHIFEILIPDKSNFKAQMYVLYLFLILFCLF